MKTVPFNQSYIAEQFVITRDLVDRGYYVFHVEPIVDTVKIQIENEHGVIFPQYTIFQITSEIQDIFPEVSVNKYIINWIYDSSSSTGNESFTPDQIWKLECSLKDILNRNIGKYIQISYVSKH